MGNYQTWLERAKLAHQSGADFHLTDDEMTELLATADRAMKAENTLREINKFGLRWLGDKITASHAATTMHAIAYNYLTEPDVP